MFNSTAVTSYRNFLTERIEELIQTHKRYKEVEGQEEGELRKMGLNSSAACIWDMKASFETALQIFDLEFAAAEKPYKIKCLHVFHSNEPEIAICDKDGGIANFTLPRVAGEGAIATIERLLDRADKFYQCSLDQEEFKEPFDVPDLANPVDYNKILGV